ncbi:MAG TPA: hypothetical protein VG317_14235 [Pseudonocardiaceae bacterium]|nr:hypothetical protein [Pseudonocardiaceae bacterium]
MSKQLSPATADAFRLLRQDLLGYLDEAENMVESLQDRTSESIESACKLIPDLTTVIRGTLADHESDDDGQCRACRITWPCASVQTIHALVKDPGREFLTIVQRAREREDLYR